ncbi:type VI secretion system baseplate subunit TssG [Burkholderia oklahomensis]|uniref:type VI secretion system baseplate subunit TssG n=1 Tax=Burkholderia oklahomensis TaxID=342113 RepID=UPI00264E3C15|nr:type VI secretion system baseplate subunit TssG [Burkholderia oklahomensis]MDN7673476.1 type VI secretion system baseplate subunit TssG [Burkholderia oklahomensis]
MAGARRQAARDMTTNPKPAAANAGANANANASADAARRAAWWRRLRAAPHGYDLFQALRWLDALSPEHAPFGYASRPHDEPVRLGQAPSLTFAAAMLADVRDDGPRPRIAIHGFGLFGPNGPLPSHLTEYAYERVKQHDDPTFAAFADLFHHRLILLFYRAWADAQPTVSLDRPARARFDTYVASLIGRRGERSGDAPRAADALAPHAKYFHAGHLVRHTRNPEGLVQILRRYFGVPARIVEHVPQWVMLDRAQRCAIRATRPTLPLGGTVLGCAVRDAQSRFRIVLGPLTLDAYRQFLPGGVHARRLAQWVREYVGIEFDWDVQLELAHDEVPALALGSRHGLGRTAWLGERLDPGPARDLVLGYDARARGASAGIKSARAPAADRAADAAALHRQPA